MPLVASAAPNGALCAIMSVTLLTGSCDYKWR
jgi:hypothetical protein